MVYYKVTCMEINDIYYVGLSTYDNNFTMTDIQTTETIVKEWNFLIVHIKKPETR